MLWSFESVFWTLFSQSSGAFVDHHSFATRFFRVQRGLSKGEKGLLRNPFARFLPTPSWTLFCKSLDESHEMMSEIIENHNKSPSQDSLLAYLSSYVFEDGSKLNEEELIAIMIDVLFPASGFTTPTSMWLLHDVATREDVQRKVFEEALLSKGDLRQCPYLFAVVRESMRLHPLQDAFVRSSTQEFVVGGYRVPAKVRLSCVASNTAVSERYFKEPLNFLPERWMDDESVQSIHPYASTPYGVGTRRCPAVSSSDIQLAILVQEAVKRYRLDSDPEEIVDAQYQPLLVPTAPFDIAFNAREDGEGF